MKVSILNLHCLNAVCDDDEDVASILGDVRQSTHGNVGAEEIVGCLGELEREGMVSRVQDVSGTDWFRITPKGREELDANWVEE